MKDTLTISKTLQDSGLETRQAEAIAQAIGKQEDRLATKGDIANLNDAFNRLEKSTKSDIDRLEKSIDGVKNDFNGLKNDFNKLEKSTKEALEKHEKNTKEALEKHEKSVKNEISSLRWIVGLSAALNTAVLAIVVSILLTP